MGPILTRHGLFCSESGLGEMNFMLSDNIDPFRDNMSFRASLSKLEDGKVNFFEDRLSEPRSQLLTIDFFQLKH